MLPRRHALTHHSPEPIGYLGILSEALNNLLDELFVILIASTKQNLANDVGGRIMKHKSRTQGFACKRH